jgi:hypothetical protein
MANQIFPLFRLNYIDYLGQIKYLEVETVIEDDTDQYYLCTIDGQDTRTLRMGEDGNWHDQEEGPTALADELGSMIEARLD